MEALFTARQRSRNWGGIILSVVLHGVALLAALWYLSQRAPMPETRLRTLPVDLILGGALMPGTSASPPAAQLQIARPRPEATPTVQGVRPDGRQPVDDLTSKLQALAQLRSVDTALPNADVSGAPGSGGAADAGQGNYALRDFIRAQILRRWLPDLSIPGARNLPVMVRVRLLGSGVIDDVAIVDQNRFHTDKPFRNMALSARDAALLASPIQLPPGKYPRATMLTIDLDPKSVLR